MRALWVTVLGLGATVIAGAAALELAAARDRRRWRAPCPLDDDVPPPWPARAVAVARRFVAECVAIVRAALALLVARPAPHPDVTPRGAVVLVPGSAALAPAMRRLAGRLEGDGWMVTIAPPPWGARDLARRAQRLAATLAAVRRAVGAATVDVVAHGAGGLVARACLASGTHAAGVGRLVTLGTPHQGSVAFRRFRLDPLAAALCPQSRALVRLASGDRLPDVVDCTAIASADDALTVPVERAYWPGAFNVTIRDVGHVGLLYAPRVWELVRENLAAPPAPTRVPASRRA